MTDAELLAEFTDGYTAAIEKVTDELTLGSSWLWMTCDGQDDWHRVVRVESLSDRTDGVRYRVTLQHRLHAESACALTMTPPGSRDGIE